MNAIHRINIHITVIPVDTHALYSSMYPRTDRYSSPFCVGSSSFEHIVLIMELISAAVILVSFLCVNGTAFSVLYTCPFHTGVSCAIKSLVGFCPVFAYFVFSV